MSAPASNRRQLLAKVHVAAKQMGLDEGVYRTMLERVTGHDSASRASDEQLVAVLDEFRRLGWEPTPKRAPKRSGKPQSRMIWALWTEMAGAGILKRPTRAALRSFVLKLTGVSDPEWLGVQQATVVIEALKAWKEREAAKAVEGGQR